MTEVCRVCGRLSARTQHDRDALPRPIRVYVSRSLGLDYAFTKQVPPKFGKQKSALGRHRPLFILPSDAVEMEVPMHVNCAPRPGKKKVLQKNRLF